MNFKTYFTKLKQSAIVLALPVLMYILLGPVEVFYGSNADFEFELKDFDHLKKGLRGISND